ncbi:MAG: hypothetical protein C0175_02075 [Caldisericum exile]|uniref:Copper amine oxidase-like N-terminal domain-containing protein n=1 Tax=Caldisericum exile TaxID=693075 RepID=A0A2J6X804_9BACT|nr:MAG: hypothetical protein C0175_02075 [Caldisericum exile]
MKKIIFILTVFIFVVMLPLTNLKAAQPNFEKPIGLYGGEIDKVLISPNYSSDSTVFAGGPEGFYISKDGGKTFNSIVLSVGYNLTFEGITDFTLSKDFAKDSTVYIATKNGVYKTNDFGKSFKPYQMGISATYVTQITNDPITNNLMAVGISFEKRQDDKVLNTNLIMVNDGTSWRTISKFVSEYVTAIASYNNNYYVGTEIGKFYKIDSSGTNLIYSTNAPITSISIRDNAYAFSTLGNGIFLSSDLKTFNQELNGYKIIGIKIDDLNNLYALSRTKKLFVKANGNYTTYDIPFPSTNISLDISPDGLFIGSYEYGIIKFNKANKTFSLSNTGITNLNTTTLSFSPNYSSNKTVYLGTANNGLYISKDGGKSFENIGNLDTHEILEVKEISNGTILVGTLGEGIFASTDSGKTFKQLDVLKNHSVSVIYEYNNTLFIGTEDDGLYKSDLNLLNLQKVKDLYPYDVNINFVKGAGNYLFVATNGGNLYRSEDSGKTFKEIANNKFWGMSITGFDISNTFTTDGLVLVGTAGGEYISYDRGNTFNQIYDLGSTWADGVQISPNYSNDGFMIVGAWGSSGTTYGNIYITKNKGLSYENIGSTLTNRYVINVFLSPDFYYGKNGSIFVLTSSGGLFRYSFEAKPIEIILTVGKNEIVINGEKSLIDAAPYIKNGRTLVPIRFISEAFGAKVDWNNATREVTIKLLDKTIILKIGSPYAIINGKQTLIDKDNLKVVPEITNGRTFVPIRFISETFGAKVEWNNETRQIRITLGG